MQKEKKEAIANRKRKQQAELTETHTSDISPSATHETVSTATVTPGNETGDGFQQEDEGMETEATINLS